MDISASIPHIVCVASVENPVKLDHGPPSHVIIRMRCRKTCCDLKYVSNLFGSYDVIANEQKSGKEAPINKPQIELKRVI
jgi:hypothetical protein